MDLTDMEIKVLKDINDGLFNSVTSTDDEFVAMRTLYERGLLCETFEPSKGKAMALTDAGREKIEEFLV